MSKFEEFLRTGKLAIDTQCMCGWPLPVSVVPLRNTGQDRSKEDDIMPGCIVALVCPACYKGHSFVLPHEIPTFMKGQST